MSEQDGKIVNLGGLKKFKEYYDTDIITPINNKIDSRTNAQSGEIITTNNDTIGYFKNIKIKGNTRYKKSDGTYTDTWESGVSLESIGEKEKNSNGKYPIIIKSSNDTKEDKRTVLLDSPLRKVGTIADVLDLEKVKVTRNCKTAIFDGSSDENWTYAGNNIFAIQFIGYKKVDLTTNSLLNCDKFAVTSHNVLNNMSGSYIAFESSYTSDNYLRIRKPDVTDLATFTTWLQSNPVTVVYQLATPITEDIEVSSNTLTDFATGCTLTIDNTIKGNIECNEVVGLIPSVEEDKTRLANLEKSLENKAEKNHNHDNNYLKLSGGTMTGTIGLPQGVGIESATNAGKGLLKETSTSVNVGFTGKAIHLYGSSISYNDSSGNKYNLYHSGNLRVGGVNNIVNGGFTNGTNGYKPNDNTTLTIVDDSASYTGKALKLICPKSNGGIFRWVSSASDSTKTTISFYAKKDSATSSLSITFGFEGIKMANAPLTDKWQRFALTIDAQQGQMLIYTLGAGTFFIHSIKVESGDRYTDWNYANQELVTTKDIAVLFERNNAKINKNVNSCFNKETGKFTASEAGQYLVMCSGHELARNSTEYVACVLNEESGNQNKLYIIGNSGFTLITLTKDQTLAIYTCVAGNMNQSCISSMPYVNMLIAKIN